MEFIVPFLFFIESGEHMTHFYLSLSYDICNTINEHNKKKSDALKSRRKVSKNYFIKKKLLIMISMLSLLECITYSLSVSSEEKMLMSIVNHIFDVSEFSIGLMILFKGRLILLRYCSIDGVLFL